jgi:hypothetical protein
MKTLLTSVVVVAMIAGPGMAMAQINVGPVAPSCVQVTHAIAAIRGSIEESVASVPPEMVRTVYDLYQPTLDRLTRQLEVCK